MFAIGLKHRPGRGDCDVGGATLNHPQERQNAADRRHFLVWASDFVRRWCGKRWAERVFGCPTRGSMVSVRRSFQLPTTQLREC